MPFEGAKFQWLAANVISKADGDPILPAYGVKTFDGRLVPVTSASAYGRVLTDIDLRIDRRTCDITGVDAINRLVRHDDASMVRLADSPVARLVAGYETLIAAGPPGPPAARP